ncbi:VOC family protein [Cohnella hashimotonis]|uniref:VOC family protein n=1 Tax=Cohnella hashimotonis TaxID=2826895 RepID=A0ABT6TBN5_9BACL|nr:VOC family protein [Cohnella hashimotonis]MDI4643735.1 VOC family protein [Cohnella hashimotonis]
MGALKPYIQSEDARAQADFYLQALGGKLMSVSTHGELMGAENEFKDKVMHMCIAVAGENYVFLADAIEPVGSGSAVALSIGYAAQDEAREAFGKLAEGGQIRHPIETQPFGLYFGELTDKFGIRWMITAG